MSWRSLLFTEPCACYFPKYWWDGREAIDESEGRYLRMFLWTGGDGLWNAEGCHVACTDLPISEELMRDLARWEADYDLIGESMVRDCCDAVWESSRLFPTEWFNRRGAALKLRLEEELGAEWEVLHHPLKQNYSWSV